MCAQADANEAAVSVQLCERVPQCKALQALQMQFEMTLVYIARQASLGQSWQSGNLASPQANNLTIGLSWLSRLY